MRRKKAQTADRQEVSPRRSARGASLHGIARLSRQAGPGTVVRPDSRPHHPEVISTASDNKRPVAVVIGVGAGPAPRSRAGSPEGHRVAMIARTADSSPAGEEIAAEGGGGMSDHRPTLPMPRRSPAPSTCSRANSARPTCCSSTPERQFGRLIGDKPSTFENTWRVNTFGAFLAARSGARHDQVRHGVILFTGATAGVKPFPTSAAFGPASLLCEDSRSDGARPWAATHPRRLYQCRWPHRHAVHSPRSAASRKRTC